MKYVLLFVFSSLLDIFYIGGTVWLVLEKGWSAWFFVLAVFLSAASFPTKILAAMKERDGLK